MDIRVCFLLAGIGLFALLLLWASDTVSSLKSLARCSLLIFLALLIRLAYFDRENTDYQWFLKVWVDFYRSSGGFSAMNASIGNYNIPYLYFLALFSYSTISDLYLIKLLSVFFDILLSWAAMLIVLRCSGSKSKSLLCFFLVLYWPTVIMNSAVWGQCDSIYVSLALLGIALILPDRCGDRPERPLLSMICIAASFGFKLQAVFIMPVWLIIWFWRKYKWYYFAAFPAAYLLLVLPAVLLGRPLKDAVLLYFNQAETVGSGLNYNAPSLTAFLRNLSSPENASLVLILCAFLAMATLLALGLFFRKKLTAESFLSLATLMALSIPFFLPHMHDRYFYLADVLTLILAVCIPLASPAAVFTEFGSLICYLAYFSGYYCRVGSTNFFLTNDRGAVAVLFAMLTVLAVFILLIRQSASGHSAEPRPVLPNAES